MFRPHTPGAYRVEISIDINAPKENVWQVLSDFTEVSWAPGVKSSYGIGKEELGIGAGRHCTLVGFGEVDEYITHFNPGEGFVYDVTPLGPLHNAYSSWWIAEDVSKGSNLNIVISYDIRYGIFGKLMHALVMQRKLRKSLSATSVAVKDRVEGMSLSENPLPKPAMS